MHFKVTLLLHFSFSLLDVVHGFGTVNSGIPIFNQNREHEKITRAALACKTGDKKSDGNCFESRSIDQLAGSTLRFGAVGNPDNLFKEGGTDPSDAHLDNADFLAGEYPRDRTQQSLILQRGVNYLHRRFTEGISRAGLMLDPKGFISKDAAKLGLAGCSWKDTPTDDIAKCRTLLQFGRFLHGAQDFYSHSNWGDRAPRPYSAVNPPGLNRQGPAPLLDLRSRNTIDVPYDLSTGCFDEDDVIDWTEADFNDRTPGIGVCANRITHNTINKDKGTIDPNTGAATLPETDRGKLYNGYNFAHAVALAIKDTQYQWRYLRSALQDELNYGPTRGNRIICALTRDEPDDCQGRKIALVIDSSGSNLETDPSNLRIAAAKEFNKNLITSAAAGAEGKPDLVTVIDFDTSARVVYPLGDPASATFDGIDSSGGTNIASGVSAAIDEITSNTVYPTFWHSGIVLLTDGQDFNRLALLAQIARALTNGIRFSQGFLSPPLSPVPGRRSIRTGSGVQRRQGTSTPADLELITAILRTGGVYSVINSAEAQANFIDLVSQKGATAIDDNTGSTALKKGLSIASLITSSETPKYFTYTAQPGEAINITITSLSAVGLNAILHDILQNNDVRDGSVVAGGHASISFSATDLTKLELVVSPMNETANGTEGVFTVELSSLLPLNGTNTTLPNANGTYLHNGTYPSGVVYSLSGAAYPTRSNTLESYYVPKPSGYGGDGHGEGGGAAYNSSTSTK